MQGHVILLGIVAAETKVRKELCIVHPHLKQTSGGGRKEGMEGGGEDGGRGDGGEGEEMEGEKMEGEEMEGEEMEGEKMEGEERWVKEEERERRMD